MLHIQIYTIVFSIIVKIHLSRYSYIRIGICDTLLFMIADSYTVDEAKYSSVVRVKPSHYQYDSSHIGEATTNDNSSNGANHEDSSKTAVYATVNRQRTTDKEKTEGKLFCNNYH